MEITIQTGSSPILLAQPHGGVVIPNKIRARLNSHGLAMADTDWHISRLYHGLIANLTVVSTAIHRYVVDANRDPSDQSLYPGQNTTSLCPTTTFDGSAIYLDGQAPSSDEVADRQAIYHQPYHDALCQQLDRLRQRHGFAILYDCHSIRSRVPFLFDGKLPDFNIGTNSGLACDIKFESAVFQRCNAASDYSTVVNGHFKGGWTTRHYGNPAEQIHAIQMELAQCNYMDEFAPWRYHETRANQLRLVLADILHAIAST